MTFKNTFTTGVAAAILAASTTFAMAQATGKENNATTGSEPGAGPASGAESKGTPGEMKGGEMKGSSGSMEMKNDKPTSAGSSDSQAKDLRGHSETPTTGSGK